METLVIVVLAIVALALAGMVLLLARRPMQGQDSTRDIAQTLIDRPVTELNAKLDKVTNLVRELEKDRENKFGQLTEQLKETGKQTLALNTTTGALREALASTRVRGQWGERMAEDVLRMVGFVDGVNYVKQKAIDGGGARPDFTFLLPRDLKLNMDVKFPLDNYLKCIEAKTQPEQDQASGDFLRDVRDRLKEVVTRDYIDPAQHTLDYVLLFIPNEQIYHFIHAQDGALMDEALKNHVVLCAPMTLFAILVVIRQAADNFAIEQNSNQIVSQIGEFNKQWNLFVAKMEVLGNRIAATQSEYELLVGRRRRALERPLNRIENIRRERGLALPAGFEVLEDDTPLDTSEADDTDVIGDKD